MNANVHNSYVILLGRKSFFIIWTMENALKTISKYNKKSILFIEIVWKPVKTQTS